MAIGDSENDRSMLSLDLRYTVAMGNAMESIREAGTLLHPDPTGRTGLPTPWRIWPVPAGGRRCRRAGTQPGSSAGGLGRSQTAQGASGERVPEGLTEYLIV